MKKEILRVQNLNTNFDGERGLRNLCINLYEGEVLGIIGLNGSGKTTIVKVLSGLCEKDSGTIYFDNRPVNIRNKKDANKLGIYAVQKSNQLIPNLTVAENIYITKKIKLKNMIVNKRTMNKEIDHVLKEFNVEIKPDTMAHKLTKGQQILIKIIKAYMDKGRLIILDSIMELCTYREKLLIRRMVEKLKKEGISFIMTNYKIENEVDIFDRIAVIRDGKRVKILHKEEFDKRLMINLAVGYEFNDSFKRIKNKVEDPILDLCNVSAGKWIKNITFHVNKGEILGIFDLEGQSSRDLIRLLIGDMKRYDGSIFMNDEEIGLNSITVAVNNGMGIISERFFGKQFLSNMTPTENVYFPILKKISGPLGYISKSIQGFMAKECIERIGLPKYIDKNGIEILGREEAYKILIDKWKLKNSQVIIIDNITMGVDIVTKQVIYSLLNDICQEGIGIIFITSDIGEMIHLSDRIVVIENGEMQGNFVVDDSTMKHIYETMLG